MAGLNAVASGAVAALSSISVQASTNINVIGRFSAKSPHRLLPLLRQNNDSVSPTAFVPETNVHFLGRHTVPQFRRFDYNVWDTGVPQPETNPHFIGHLTQTKYKIIAALRQNYPTNDVQPETNTYFIGRFASTRYSIQIRARQNAANESVSNVLMLESANAVDLDFATVELPQPCPCKPVIGPGSGSNVVVVGPGPKECPIVPPLIVGGFE